MPNLESVGTVSHGRYSSFFLILSDKMISLGLHCPLESAKAGSGERSWKVWSWGA